MASPKMKEAASKFPEGDADAELNPGKNKSVEVDPKASEVTSLQIKAEDNKKKEKKEKNEAAQSLKTTIIVSGVIVALIGAIFALTKKLREK
ncbi:PREDICTED: uncharacterized protein LOC101303257 [Fragaria vesca subsp. vesca]